MRKNLQKEYDKDFYAWTLHNAELIRQGKFSEIDIEHIAEEIESMGKSDKRELVNRLAILIAHLLKWQFQSEKRSNSWKTTIKEQRMKVNDLLEESPSLKHELDLKLAHAYEHSTLIAVRVTGLSEKTFPEKCPFSLNECLRSDFFPS
jgi:hypothetical protein